MSHSMQQIKVEKVTLNVGIGEVSEEVDKACMLLEQLTGKKAVKTRAKKTSKSFGLREGLEVGAKVTLRGKEAVEFLEEAFEAVESLPTTAFDSQGNFSFGIEEYLNLPEVKYDPEIGIMGFDVAVTLEKVGGASGDHKTKKEESISFIRDNFSISVGEKGDNE